MTAAVTVSMVWNTDPLSVSRAARQHDGIRLPQRPKDPEPTPIKPENRDLLQFPREVEGFLLRYHDSDAALAVRAIRRTRVHVRKLVSLRCQ